MSITQMLLLLIPAVCCQQAAQPEPMPPVDGPPVALVSRLHQTVWERDTTTWKRGDKLHAGDELRLASGFLEVKFDNGSTLVLEGPAVVRISARDKAVLIKGKLVTKKEREGEPLRIETPDFQILDLG